jgi:hypothetical protein
MLMQIVTFHTECTGERSVPLFRSARHLRRIVDVFDRPGFDWHAIATLATFL